MKWKKEKKINVQCAVAVYECPRTHARTHTLTHSSLTSVLWSWNAVQRRLSWESNSSRLVKKFPAFYEPEGSLPGSQKPATCSNPEPDEWARVTLCYLFKIRFTFTSHLGWGLPSGLFSSDFPAEFTSSPPPYVPHETRVLWLVRFGEECTYERDRRHHDVLET